jgi:hypothetical protein
LPTSSPTLGTRRVLSASGASRAVDPATLLNLLLHRYTAPHPPSPRDTESPAAPLHHRHLGHNAPYHPTYRGFSSWLGLPYSGDMGCLDSTPQGCHAGWDRTIGTPACPALCPDDAGVGGCGTGSAEGGCVAIPLYDTNGTHCAGTDCAGSIVQQPYDPFGLNSRYAARATLLIKEHAKRARASAAAATTTTADGSSSTTTTSSSTSSTSSQLANKATAHRELVEENPPQAAEPTAERAASPPPPSPPHPSPPPLFMYVAFAHTHTLLAFAPRWANSTAPDADHTPVFANTLAEVDWAVGEIARAADASAESWLIWTFADNGPRHEDRTSPPLTPPSGSHAHPGPGR